MTPVNRHYSSFLAHGLCFEERICGTNPVARNDTVVWLWPILDGGCMQLVAADAVGPALAFDARRREGPERTTGGGRGPLLTPLRGVRT
jgi:hypothetical protein